MLILHAAWIRADGERGAALAFWGEDDAIVRRSARRSHSAVPAHPFGASSASIRETLAGVGPTVIGRHAEAIAWLPALEGVPLASPEVGLPLAPAPEIIPVLTPYRVSCLLLDSFDTGDALQALVALAADRLGAGVEIGADAHFWQRAVLLVLSLLARQRFMPDLESVGGQFAARWRPLIGEGADARGLESLATAMPPAARALTWADGATFAGPRTVLRDFMRVAVDGFARSTLSERVQSLPDSAPGDAWLASLCGAPLVAGRPSELAVFRQVFQIWHNPGGVAGAAEAPFRLCFRLEPLRLSADGGVKHSRWQLNYLLQATDDLSLLVPAAAVWGAKASTAAFLDRRFDQPQERVLTALGHAARLFPPIERGLRTARPASVELDTDDAYLFVKEAGPLLAEAGFGVLLPGMENRIGLRLKLAQSGAHSPTGAATFTWDSVVSFDWEVAIGDETIPRAEFEALVNLKEPLVQVRGQWVELHPDVLAKTLALLREHPAGDAIPLAEAMRLALAPESALALPVESVQAEGVFGELLDTLVGGASREDLEEPAGFEGRLRPYQKVGVSWLATLARFGLGACLADDMGLGKTVQLIALLLHRRRSTDTALALLICPTSVVANWRRELERFAPSLRVLVHHGTGRNRAEFAAAAAQHDVVISSYALLHRDAELLGGIEWGELILDEAQNIKNPGTKAAQTARSLNGRWRAALTGTPVENHLSDLWSIFQFINPGLLGSADAFRRDFALPIERDQDPAVSARLQKLVGPFMLRRLKSDKTIIADLPEKNEAKVFCTLTREQATLYQAVLKESIDQIEESSGIQRRGQILATLAKLKQVCDHPALLLHDGSRLVGRSGKLTRLEEMLEEVVSEGDRALVFTQYAEMGTLLVRHLQETLGREVLFLHGGTPASARERMVARFQADGRAPQVFVLSIKAGGTGLNLTRANHVFHFDRWWNPAVENQATDRAFRIGQRRDVQVHKFICAGTFEETIDQLIERKLALSETIVGSGEAWITELSPAGLREMFSLRSDAVVSE